MAIDYGSFEWPPNGGGSGVSTYSTLSAFPPTAVTGSLAIALDTGNLYEYNGTSWVLLASESAALSLGNLDSQSATAQGAALNGGVLSMQSASDTAPGLVNTGAQIFFGAKTFSAAPNLSSLTASTALALNSSKNIASSSTTTTELGFVHGVTSAIQTQLNALQPAGSYITALTGDGTASGPGSVALTLATVNSNTGSFGSSTSIPAFAVNGKGLITSASGNAVIAPAGTLSGTVLNSTVVTSSLAALGTQSQALNMGSHQITALADPTTAQMAATKNYVDTQLAQLNPAAAVLAATIGSNISATYSNGASGIGATLTITATTTFTLDGQTPAVGNRILFKDQSSGFQNGVYTLTTLANVGVLGAILTRALDYDSATDMNSGQIIPVQSGSVNAGSSWYNTATITTVGTDALTFTEFQKASSAYLLAANNLSDVATKATAFNNISPLTTGGDLIYGGASGAGTRLANGTVGQVLTSGGTTAPPTWASPSAAPTGQISMFGASSAPSGWQNCDGSAISRTTFAALFAIIDTTFGAGDGTTTFNVPDMRGIFPRGTGTNGTLTYAAGGSVAGPALGATQVDQAQGHQHTFLNDVNVNGGSSFLAGLVSGSGSFGAIGLPSSDGTNGTPRTGLETRPFNLGLSFIIKT